MRATPFATLALFFALAPLPAAAQSFRGSKADIVILLGVALAGGLIGFWRRTSGDTPASAFTWALMVWVAAGVLIYTPVIDLLRGVGQ